MRILVLIAIGLLLYVIIGNLLRRSRSNNQTQSRDTETMVRCAQCGLHLAEREAIKKGDDYFCSTQHLEGYHKSK